MGGGVRREERRRRREERRRRALTLVSNKSVHCSADVIKTSVGIHHLSQGHGPPGSSQLPCPGGLLQLQLTVALEGSHITSDGSNKPPGVSGMGPGMPW